MTAKEMFEEYNLKQKICRFQGKIVAISYVSEENYKPQVRFDLENKTYKVFFKDYRSNDENVSVVDMELHKFINKQVEELGWK